MPSKRVYTLVSSIRCALYIFVFLFIYYVLAYIDLLIIMNQVITHADGSTTGYNDYGGPGYPCVLCHGAPDCRVMDKYSVELAKQNNVRLICFDRPGYGLSSPKPGHEISDVSIDAMAIIDALKIEYFYNPKHQKIFEAIVNLFNNTEPIDILTVSEELKRLKYFNDVGGLSYVSELTNNVSTASNTEFHARIIAEKFIKRS